MPSLGAVLLPKRSTMRFDAVGSEFGFNEAAPNLEKQGHRARVQLGERHRFDSAGKSFVNLGQIEPFGRAVIYDRFMLDVVMLRALADGCAVGIELLRRQVDADRFVVCVGICEHDPQMRRIVTRCWAIKRIAWSQQ